MRDTSDPADCGEQSVCGFLSQFLNTHVFIEFRIFTIQDGSMFFTRRFRSNARLKSVRHAAGSVLWSYRYRCWTGTAVIRTGFLNNDAMFVEVFRHDLAGIPKSLMVPSFSIPGVSRWLWSGQDTCARYRCFWSRASAVRTQRPAFSRIDMIRLPYSKNQPSDSVLRRLISLRNLMHVQWNRWSDAYLHCLSSSPRGFSGRHDTVVRRGGGVHHVASLKVSSFTSPLTWIMEAWETPPAVCE